ASGYRGGRPVPPLDLSTVAIGAGDLWSTTGDLARWLTALSTTPLLSRRSRDAIFAPHAAIPNPEFGLASLAYGYGWYLAQVDGHRVFAHPGGNAGFTACAAILPDDAVQVIVLANDEQSDAPAIAFRLVRALTEG
ncbi:MAG TPA: serine hydrolase domain-containing protein, partial [Dehalococcoidia bacterium]|nr:serine hydrolase domain-containing protein [Dehalococcoidia bacterium]